MAAAVVGAIVYAFIPDPVAVDLAVIGAGDIEVTVDEDGRTRLKDRYQVSAPLGGRLLRLELKAGDEVVAGSTVLGRIEPVPPSLLDSRARNYLTALFRSGGFGDGAVVHASAVLGLASIDISTGFLSLVVLLASESFFQARARRPISKRP